MASFTAWFGSHHWQRQRFCCSTQNQLSARMWWMKVLPRKLLQGSERLSTLCKFSWAPAEVSEHSPGVRTFSRCQNVPQVLERSPDVRRFSRCLKVLLELQVFQVKLGGNCLFLICAFFINSWVLERRLSWLFPADWALLRTLDESQPSFFSSSSSLCLDTVAAATTHDHLLFQMIYQWSAVLGNDRRRSCRCEDSSSGPDAFSSLLPCN